MFYIQYIRHLHKHTTKISSSRDDGSQQYNDYLQAPLQPLMDNLESQIYETFEKDPVKYDRYEQAICKALKDLKTNKEFSTSKIAAAPILGEMIMSVGADSRPGSPCGDEHQEFVVTVVGAGRGPLVAAVLNAACSANSKVKIYAVEKNPNAVITLRNRVKTESWTNVSVVAADMRHWSPPELADILVSELLGSWGDNELSPECLDGAQKCLKTGTGISIPCSYTSYLAPVSAQKLWRYVQEIPDKKVESLLYN
jgi:protein arginine N-methyltransferase 5